jgi:hypothetical protein
VHFCNDLIYKSQGNKMSYTIDLRENKSPQKIETGKNIPVYRLLAIGALVLSIGGLGKLYADEVQNITNISSDNQAIETEAQLSQPVAEAINLIDSEHNQYPTVDVSNLGYMSATAGSTSPVENIQQQIPTETVANEQIPTIEPNSDSVIIPDVNISASVEEAIVYDGSSCILNGRKLDSTTVDGVTTCTPSIY